MIDSFPDDFFKKWIEQKVAQQKSIALLQKQKVRYRRYSIIIGIFALIYILLSSGWILPVPRTCAEYQKANFFERLPINSSNPVLVKHPCDTVNPGK